MDRKTTAPLIFTLALFAASCPLPAQTTKAPAAKNTSAQGSTLQATLEQKEKAVWEAFKNKDQRAFSDLCTPDYTAVVADGKGERDLKAAVDSMRDITIVDFSLGDIKLTPFGPNAVMLTYTASGHFAVAGQPQVLKVAVTDLWVKRAGQWKSLRYHETEVR